jgi:hypothetical protein
MHLQTPLSVIARSFALPGAARKVKVKSGQLAEFKFLARHKNRMIQN